MHINLLPITLALSAATGVSYICAKGAIHAGHALSNNAQDSKICQVTGIILKVLGGALGVAASLATVINAAWIGGELKSPSSSAVFNISIAAGVIFASILLVSIIQDLRQPTTNQNQRKQERDLDLLQVIAQPTQGVQGAQPTYQLFIAPHGNQSAQQL